MSFLKNISDDSQESKGFIEFGLNTGFISKLVAEEGQYGFQIAVEFTSDKGNKKNWINFPYVKGSNGSQLKDRTTKEYQDGLKKVAGKMLGTVLHYLKGLSVPEATVQQAIQRVPYNDNLVTSEYLENVCREMLKTLPDNYASRPVDVFLHWDKLKDGNTRNFVALPNNMSADKFIHPSVKVSGSWELVEDDEGLHYVDKNGTKHPLVKTKSFLKSHFNKEVNLGGETKKVDMTVNKTASAAGAFDDYFNKG